VSKALRLFLKTLEDRRRLLKKNSVSRQLFKAYPSAVFQPSASDSNSCKKVKGVRREIFIVTRRAAEIFTAETRRRGEEIRRNPN
jgi:hypothetical protein